MPVRAIATAGMSRILEFGERAYGVMRDNVIPTFRQGQHCADYSLGTCHILTITCERWSFWTDGKTDEAIGNRVCTNGARALVRSFPSCSPEQRRGGW